MLTVKLYLLNTRSRQDYNIRREEPQYPFVVLHECHRTVCSTSLYFPKNKMRRRLILNEPEPELNEPKPELNEPEPEPEPVK
jgi:hypothetical protein